MSVASMARAAAVHCEGKWHALRRDNKTGDWLMTFTIATTDFPALVRDASPGQRFMLALVAIGDDELPRHPDPQEEQRRSFVAGNVGLENPDVTREMVDAVADKPRRRWHELSRAQRAGMLCEDAEFRWWLEKGSEGRVTITNADEAARWVRNLCRVPSRADLDEYPPARRTWDALETRFMQETGRMAVDR